MLILQRASAGSGKTYTLTKQYLKLLLTIKDNESQKRRLRSEPEIPEGVSKIMAVTFTNKATNEMKERILSKLNALAFPPAEPERLAKVDYLTEFINEYGSSVEEISRLARYALSEVLFQYSEFNVSTIDAFFQNILRTFAYESDLPESYNLIIDGTYLAQLAVRDLLDDYSLKRLNKEENYWIRKLVIDQIKSGKNSWSLFQKKVSQTQFTQSLFNRLISMGNALEKEEFKINKHDIEVYFNSERSLYDEAQKIRKELTSRLGQKYKELADCVKQIIEVYTEIVADSQTKLPSKMKGEELTWGMLIFDKERKANALLNLTTDKDTDLFNLPFIKGPKSPEKVFSSGVIPTENMSKRAQEIIGKFMTIQQEYQALLESVDIQFWKLIEPDLPVIAVMNNLRRRIADYLKDNDSMQIADTNTILHKIIGDNDVSFVYERIGTRINHFLIDEFQDTSLLQWLNFKPLLSESMSKGEDNLIIGDAKQSIYRFRSAEPKIITSIVPDSFRDEDIDKRGFSEADNTNWRSKEKVVRFNNFFFYSLAKNLDEYNKEWQMPLLSELYSNTIQKPDDNSKKGYVRIECIDESATLLADSNGEESSDSAESGITKPVIEKVGNLIKSLLERGYIQKDIAILVNTNKAGVGMIEGLMEFNKLHAEEMPTLKFVSDESLKLTNSQAVRMVIECFRLLQAGIEEGIENIRNENSDKKEKINWSEIGQNFSYYSSRHQDLSLEDKLKGFINEGVSFDEIFSITSEMQAMTLPSLMEAFTEQFIPEYLRKEDAPFLAAFQDAVLDYCEVNPADIGSFLKWWERKGKDICISSPEGTEAISVMTIHASKGLEFKCVILPDININFATRNEWKWIKTPSNVSYHDLLPESVVVTLDKKTAETTLYEPYKKEFESLQYFHEVDQINKVYVAFTRAIFELYIFLPPLKNGAKGYPFNKSLTEILEQAYEIISEAQEKKINYLPDVDTILHHDEEGNLIEKDPIENDEDKKKDKKPLDWGVFEYGNPIENVAEELSKYRRDDGKGSVDLTDYYVNSSRKILKYHPEGKKIILNPADEDRHDPRSEGSILHAVLENVLKEDDLKRAFEIQRVRGLITRKDIRKFYPLLKNALESVRERGWFVDSKQVMTERPVFQKNVENKRPDRIMIDDEGVCTIVDYKFGDKKNGSAHRSQVRGYMEQMKNTGHFKKIEGYLWYVKYGEIVKVDSTADSK